MIQKPTAKVSIYRVDLTKELIDEAIIKAIPFSSVVVDSWYTSTELIEFVSSKNLSLTVEVKTNRSIFFAHPQTKQWRQFRGDEIIHLIRQFYPHNRTERSHHCLIKLYLRFSITFILAAQFQHSAF